MASAEDRLRVAVSVEPRCRHADLCGGCEWQHLAYPEQLDRKRRQVRESIEAALGRRAPSVEPVIGMSPAPISDSAPASDSSDTAAPRDPLAPWGFRHKAAFVFGSGPGGSGLVMGHYRRGTNQIVPVAECPVHAESANRVAFALHDAMAEAGIPAASADLSRGLLRHLVVRASASSGETLATLVVTANHKMLRRAVRRLLDGPEAPTGLHLNVHERPGPYLFGRTTIRLYGRARLRDEIAGLSFLVSPTAFFQTNPAAASGLVNLVQTALPSPPGRVLDLYAGSGLFSLPLAARGFTVTAVEESREAVEDGRASQRLGRVPPERCRFICASVETVIDWLATGARRVGGLVADTVIVDPPRAGCDARVLAAIATRVQPARIIYVSCDPGALARDLVVLGEAGYCAERVQPVDMFPHAPHVESVAVLDRTR